MGNRAPLIYGSLDTTDHVDLFPMKEWFGFLCLSRSMIAMSQKLSVDIALSIVPKILYLLCIKLFNYNTIFYFIHIGVSYNIGDIDPNFILVDDIFMFSMRKLLNFFQLIQLIFRCFWQKKKYRYIITLHNSRIGAVASDSDEFLSCRILKKSVTIKHM